MRKLKTVITALALAGPAACLAGPLKGPFCVVVTGLPADCKYYDETTCTRFAVERGGACIDRSSGFATGISKGARYCLIGVGDSKCYYYDEASCVRAVKDFGGTCVERIRARPGS